MMKRAVQVLSAALMALVLAGHPAPALAAGAGTDAPSMPVVSADPAREELDDLALRHADVVGDGTYALASTLEGGYVLVGDGSEAALGEGATSTDASWVITHDETGYVTVRHAASGRALSVSSSNPAAGTAVTLSSSSGSWAQKWVAVDEGGGFVLASALDRDLVLDATESGMRLRAHDGSGAQLWVLADPDELEGGPVTAPDAVPAGTYYIASSVGQGKVVEVAGGSTQSGANVQLGSSNGTPAQRWTISYDAEGYATIVNEGSDKVLGVAGGSPGAGANVQQGNADGSRAQMWAIEPVGDSGAFRLRSALGRDLALDVVNGSSADSTNIRIYTANGSVAQTFTFVPATRTVAPCDDVLPAGWFSLASAANEACVVDIAGSSSSDGDNAQMAAISGSASQLFRFEYHNGYYLIINGRSGKALRAASASTVPPINVEQGTASASSASQQFSATDNGDGTYSFVNRATGLTLRAGSTWVAGGSNVDVAEADGSAAQRFSLREELTRVDEGLYSLRPSGAQTALTASASGSVAASSCRTSSAQKWFVECVDAAQNAYVIESMSTGKRLSAGSGTGVTLASASGATAQRWVPHFGGGTLVTFENLGTGQYLKLSSNGSGLALGAGPSGACALQLTGESVLESGTYLIRSPANQAQVVEVANGSSANGANVQLYSEVGSAAQIWDVWQRDDGTYLIKNAASGKALDVQDGQTASGTNVRLWQKNGSRAQAWTITFERGAGYRIASVLNPSLVLSSSGSNIVIATDAGSATQRFLLDETSYTPPILDTVSWVGVRWYTEGREGNDWMALVIHISECTTLSAVDNTFLGTSQTSAHFGVSSTEIHQYVALDDTSWAVGNWTWNTRTVSIEHVGTTAWPPSRATLDRSAQLMAALARLKQWPELVLGENVGVHKWYSATSCPATLDVTYLVSKANEYMGNGFTYKSVDDGAAKPAFSPMASPTPVALIA